MEDIMHHDPGAIIFSWVFTGLIVVLAVIIIKDQIHNNTGHNLSDAHCNHNGYNK